MTMDAYTPSTIKERIRERAKAALDFFGSLLQGYRQEQPAFSLSYAVNSIAMPLIGGMTHWSGPVLGALLLGGVQQYFGSKNIITPELSLLFVGLLMMVFVAVAPNGLLGLLQRLRWGVKS